MHHTSWLSLKKKKIKIRNKVSVKNATHGRVARKKLTKKQTKENTQRPFKMSASCYMQCKTIRALQKNNITAAIKHMVLQGHNGYSAYMAWLGLLVDSCCQREDLEGKYLSISWGL